MIYSTMFGLADGNNFFVSAERVFQPHLVNKPVIVKSANQYSDLLNGGCVIARSNEVKAMGIKMGTPIYQLADFIRRNGIYVLPTNFELYGDLSDRMIYLISTMAEIEKNSIDEAFLNLTDQRHLPLWEYGREIVIKTSRGCGIPISLGIGPSKTLSKIASRFAKKYPGYKSVCVIDTEEKRLRALSLTNIGDVWGVGSEYEKFLKRYNVKTAYDFTCMPKHWVRKNMTVVGEKMWRELYGEACFELEPESLPKKQICNSNSFGQEITDLSDLKAIVARFADEGAKELRKQGSCAFTILVYVTTNPYKSEIKPYNRSIIKTFGVPTNSSMQIVKASVECIDLIYEKGYSFKSAGVILRDFVPEAHIQLNLYESYDLKKHARLMETTDLINGDGVTKVNLAVEGVGKSKLNGMSNRYTTNTKELLHVKCYSL